MKENIEIWKDVKGYEGLYQVSNFGNVRSLNRISIRNNKEVNLKGKVLTPLKTKAGYLQVLIYKKGYNERLAVHRIVAINFISNPEKKLTINHIDGIKTNNSVWNLEWNTHSENLSHAYSKNLRSAKGSKNGKSKLTEKDVLEIRNSNMCTKDLMSKYDVCQSTISYLKSRKTWDHI